MIIQSRIINKRLLSITDKMDSENEQDTWSNWTQTNFKNYRIFKKWNINRFTNYHLKFFKYKNPSFILKHEIGAKLALFAIKNIGIRECLEYKILRICIVCQNLINNPDYPNSICLEQLRQNMTENMWNSHKLRIINASNASQPFEMTECLNHILKENLKFLETNERMLRFLRSIWENDKRIKFYLKLIYEDIYIYTSTYTTGSDF